MEIAEFETSQPWIKSYNILIETTQKNTSIGEKTTVNGMNLNLFPTIWKIFIDFRS